MSIVDQIIDLKQKHNLVEKDATLENQREWYSWALKNGHCVVVKTLFGRVRGFLEWVRLNEFPKNKYHYEVDHFVMSTAPIAYVRNTYAEDRDVLIKLKNMALKHNVGLKVKWLCWFHEKRDKLYIRSLA